MNFDYSDDQKFLKDEARKFLTAHCGSPVLGWRVFTGEEAVRWTGAGRF